MSRKPKERDSVYSVVRTSQYGEFYLDPYIVGVYMTPQRADEVAGRYAQEMLDRGIEGFKFEVQVSSYYDE